MATKKTAAPPNDGAQAAEKVNNTASVAQEGAANTPENGYLKWVYIGPSLPGGKLKKDSVFKGDRAAVLSFLSEIVSEFPQVEHLLVPVEKFAEKKQRAETNGNIMNKWCNDIRSTGVAERNGE